MTKKYLPQKFTIRLTHIRINLPTTPTNPNLNLCNQMIAMAFKLHKCQTAEDLVSVEKFSVLIIIAEFISSKYTEKTLPRKH